VNRNNTASLARSLLASPPHRSADFATHVPRTQCATWRSAATVSSGGVPGGAKCATRAKRMCPR
jgi:hypothetical protein